MSGNLMVAIGGTPLTSGPVKFTIVSPDSFSGVALTSLCGVKARPDAVTISFGASGNEIRRRRSSVTAGSETFRRSSKGPKVVFPARKAIPPPLLATCSPAKGAPAVLSFGLINATLDGANRSRSFDSLG